MLRRGYARRLDAAVFPALGSCRAVNDPTRGPSACEASGACAFLAENCPLEAFSEAHGALCFTSPEAGMLGSTQEGLAALMSQANTIYFNMEGISMVQYGQYLQNPAQMPFRWTRWELDTILSNPNLFQKTIFLHG